MPRFTIGSIATGTALFLFVLFAYRILVGERVVAQTARATAPGTPAAMAVDPARGVIAMDGPNDYGLSDDGDWSAGELRAV